MIGIGVNVNQTDFEELKTKAVSIKQITGKDFEPLFLTKELCEIVEERFQLLMEDPSQIITLYKSRLYKLDETVRLKRNNRIFDARFIDVTTEGQMIVQHSVEEGFSVGEVEWVINGA